MPIASNTSRPHVGMIASAPIARDAVPTDRDEAIRQLIALAPEGDRAALEDLLLGDADGAGDGVHKPMIHAQDALVDRLADLARAGRMDKFAELAFGLPNLHRVEAPAARRAPVAQDSYARALASGERAAAASEIAELFPNLNRI